MKYYIKFILFICPVYLSGQINYQYNGIRPGDEIIKQQVEYKDPGREGEKVIWDFSKLKSINDRYTVTYKSPQPLNDSTYKMGKDLFKIRDIDPASLIIGVENNTMYYFRQSASKLEVLGHENPTTLLQYTTPMAASVYPTNYGQSYTSGYESQGLYSKRTPFESKGTVKITADALGMIILPSGDTLEHIIRTKTVQIINETVKSRKPQSFNFITETYKWYSKGYRYPIFESVKTFTAGDTLQTKVFKTAFFFPPQEHLYLDDDTDNLAVLDSLWNLKHPVKDALKSAAIETIKDFSYNYYPNPVETQLTIEYYLNSSTNVTISLYSMDGKLMKKVAVGKKDKGMHSEFIDCNNFSKGAYILRFEANNTHTNAKIIKR